MKKFHLILLLGALALIALLIPKHAASEVETVATSTEALTTSSENTYETRAALIADAIYEAEGRCDHLHGGSGEYGCFQYLPSTWKAYSTEVAGYILPQTGANERIVTEGMIRTWLAQGISERGIFLLWNQGSATGWGGGTDCYAGVNKYGVAYDSCAYAARAEAFLQSLINTGE